MLVKMFEIRDAATFLSVFAVKLDTVIANRAESFLMQRLGWCRGESAVYLTWPSHGKCISDPNQWGPHRTLKVAHHYIVDHWDELESGDVVDVEFILGLRPEPKVSEREVMV